MRNTFNIDFSTYVFIDEIKVSQDNTYLLTVMPSDVLYAKLLYLTLKKNVSCNPLYWFYYLQKDPNWQFEKMLLSFIPSDCRWGNWGTECGKGSSLRQVVGGTGLKPDAWTPKALAISTNLLRCPSGVSTASLLTVWKGLLWLLLLLL